MTVRQKPVAIITCRTSNVRTTSTIGSKAFATSSRRSIEPPGKFPDT